MEPPPPPLQTHITPLQKYIYATENIFRRNPAGLKADSMHQTKIIEQNLLILIPHKILIFVISLISVC